MKRALVLISLDLLALAGPAPALAQLPAVQQQQSAVVRPQPIVPKNWEAIFVGDSRTARAITATYGISGYAPSFVPLGYPAWIQTATGNRIHPALYPNFGQSGSSTQDIGVVPRLNGATLSQGVWMRCDDGLGGCGSSNKGADAVNAHSAGVVIVHTGTNDGNPSTASAFTNQNNWAGSSRTSLTAFINAVSADKLIILLNDTGRGINQDGTAAPSSSGQLQAGSSADKFKAYSDWIKTWDFAAGGSNSRRNVIVVDTWFDATVWGSTQMFNKTGYLLPADGLHDTPYGALRKAQMVDARLREAFGSTYIGLPPIVPMPTTDGVTTWSNALPYLTTSPNFKAPAGAAHGTINMGAGDITACPATSIPQGWVVTGNPNPGGLVVTCSNTADADGSNLFNFSVTGTLVTGSGAAITFTNNVTNPFSVANVSAGNPYSIQDQIKMVARVKLDPGSLRLRDIGLKSQIFASTGTQGALALVGNTTQNLFLNDTVNGLDVGAVTDWLYFETPPISGRDPNTWYDKGWLTTSVTNPSSLVNQLSLQFDNTTGSTQSVGASLHFSKAGTLRITQNSTSPPTDAVYVGTTPSAVTGTTATLTFPGTPAVGDAAVFMVENVGATPPTLPSGWTQLYAGANLTASANSALVATKILDAGDVSAGNIVVSGTTNNGAAIITSYRGGVTSITLGSNLLNTITTAPTLPGFARAGDHFGALAYLVSTGSNASVSSSPNGFHRLQAATVEGSFSVLAEDISLNPGQYYGTAAASVSPSWAGATNVSQSAFFLELHH